MSKDRPYVVIYATRTALVSAPNKDAAWLRFLAEMFPPSPRGGRLAPPLRSEVVIRRLRPDDRGWIDEYTEQDAAPFLVALEGA